MMDTIRGGALLLLALLFGSGCGRNLAEPGSGFVNNPKDIEALSVDSSTVKLRWAMPDGMTDSSVQGFRIAYLSRSFTVPKSTFLYTAGSLPAGEVDFTLTTLGTGGGESEGATIRWAPAARFDTAMVLVEFQTTDDTRTCGLEVGTALRNPGVLSFATLGAAQAMDVYLWGEGTSPAPLELRSPSLYSGGYNLTLFSSETDSASSLDFYRSQFPQDFSQLSMPVKDNTIYYVRVVGENATQYYARLHVQVLGGSAPNRTIGVTISLQRTPFLPLAGLSPSLRKEAVDLLHSVSVG